MSETKKAEPGTGGAPPVRRDLVPLAGLTCAGAVVVIAILGLVGGLLGKRLVDSSALLHVPMAPSTATLFLLLGGLLLLRTATEPPFPGRRASGLLLLAASAVALLELGDWLTGRDMGFMDIFYRRLDAWSGVPHVEMSPATAAFFALTCAAYWSLEGRRGSWPAPAAGLRAAGVLGASVALGGCVFLLGYAYSTPLLYGSSVVPMAQSTALAFLLLGAALVCEAGLELQPLRLFAGPSTRAMLLRSFVPLVVGLSLAHSLVFGLGGPHFGQGNALFVAGIAVGDALLVGLAVLLVARRVGGDLEWAETQRSEAEARIRAALHEKTEMLKEIHHRVKNNMQIISSLFTLQTQYVADPRDRVLFEESRERIRSMALVHEDLYVSDDLSAVDMGRYVPRLVSQLVAGAAPPVRTEFEVADLRLPITLSVPCGMLLNEVVMNALKHAFAGAGEPVLRVALVVDNGDVVLTVEDNGPGLPPGFSLADRSTFGMLLAGSLAEQLHGLLTAESTGSGARFVLRFPLGAPEPAAPGPPVQTGPA